MGIGEYWCGGSSTEETIQLGRKSSCSSDQPRCGPSISSSSGMMRRMRWKLICLNLTKEKSAGTAARYDEFSYSLNFDQGDAVAAMDEPEYFRRSFSVRYADPSSRRRTTTTTTNNNNNNNNPSLL